jgi:hypothetical protein
VCFQLLAVLHSRRLQVLDLLACIFDLLARLVALAVQLALDFCGHDRGRALGRRGVASHCSSWSVMLPNFSRSRWPRMSMALTSQNKLVPSMLYSWPSVLPSPRNCGGIAGDGAADGSSLMTIAKTRFGVSSSCTSPLGRQRHRAARRHRHHQLHRLASEADRFKRLVGHLQRAVAGKRLLQRAGRVHFATRTSNSSAHDALAACV